MASTVCTGVLYLYALVYLVSLAVHNFPGAPPPPPNVSACETIVPYYTYALSTDTCLPAQNTTWNESLLQMKPTCHGNLVTSVGSGLLSLWRPTHGKLIYHLTGQSNATNCLEVVGDQLISAASNGNIVIHTSFESSVSAIPTYIC